MSFLRKTLATTLGVRHPAFGSMRFHDDGAHWYWKGEMVLDGQRVGLTVFAGLDGPTDLQRAEYERIQPRLPELLTVALTRLSGMKKPGYGSVEALRPAVFMQQISFQPAGTPSVWGVDLLVNDRKNVDQSWIANVQFRGDAISHVDLRRD